MGRYLSIDDLWRLALPKALSPAEFEPGTCSAVTTTSAAILEPTRPRAAWAQARVRAVVGGAPGAARLALSTDGGATWGPSVLVPESGQVEAPTRELQLLLVGTCATGDTWSFSTTDPPELALHLAAAEDEADGYLSQTLTLPLLTVSTLLRRHVAGLAAESLMRLRGLDPKSADWATYRAGRKDALEWLQQIGTAQANPIGLTESPPPVSFADNVHDPAPYPLPL